MNVRALARSSAVLALSMLPSLAYGQHYQETDLVSNVAAPPVEALVHRSVLSRLRCPQHLGRLFLAPTFVVRGRHASAIEHE